MLFNNTIIISLIFIMTKTTMGMIYGGYGLYSPKYIEHPPYTMDYYGGYGIRGVYGTYGLYDASMENTLTAMPSPILSYNPIYTPTPISDYDLDVPEEPYAPPPSEVDEISSLMYSNEK